MPKIPDEIIRRIQDIAKIEDVVGDCGVTLRKAGVNLTGLCPFHEDRHDGNFIVRPSSVPEKRGGNTYRCFVCDKKGGPVTFLMEHERLSFPDAIRWLGKKYNVPVDDVPLNYTPPPPRPAPPPLPRLTMPREWVSGLMRRGYPTNFITWLYRLPWSDTERTRLQQTLWQYCIAGYKDGRVVFWLIEPDGTVRTAKLMRYLDDGHRDKQSHPGWLHNQDGIRQRVDPEGHEIPKPLFGAHLLRRYPEATVNVVESEKTAIIMQNYFGEPEKSLWVAVGGLSHLQLEAMQPLIDQQRTVWLWPDRDGIDRWRELRDKLGSDKIQIYTAFFDRCYIPEEDGPKADVADIAIRLMGGGRVPEQKTNTGDGQGATEQSATASYHSGATHAPTPDSIALQFKTDGVTDEEWLEHSAIMQAIQTWKLEYAEDEPFLDPIELQDPRVRMWREILRQRYNFNKRKRQ